MIRRAASASAGMVRWTCGWTRPAGSARPSGLIESGEAELERVLVEFGEERFHRRIARAIALARQRAPIATTARLAAIVCRCRADSRTGQASGHPDFSGHPHRGQR
jgi:hypothetical protein